MSASQLTFRVSEHVAGGVAAGATLGHRNLQQLLSELPKDLLAATTVFVDFEGIHGLTPSWVKAFLAPLLASAERKDSAQAPELDAIRVEVYVQNLNDDLIEDLSAALGSVGRPCLEALVFSGDVVEHAHVHGPVEEKIRTALNSLLSAGRGTAAELRELDRSIGVSGWHYRLMELQKLGLARRIKSGRSWIYEPVVKELTHG